MNPELVLGKGDKVRQAGADRDLGGDLRLACERSLYVFNKAICGFSKFVSHLHLPLCNWMQAVPPRRRVLLMPRGTYKTSILRGFGPWATIQAPYSNPLFPGRDGRNLRFLYVCENEKRAVSRLSWIRRFYMRNRLFRAMWPAHIWHHEKDAEVWTLSRFALPRNEDYPEATFEAAGVDSGSTGGHYDILVKDDLIGERCLKQPELIGSAINWWKTSHSLFDDEVVDLDYVLGTRWRTEDLYSWVFANETDYDVRIYAASKRPLDLPPSGNVDSDLLFPEKYDRAMLAELRRKYGQLYWLNYENEPFQGGNAAFNMLLCGECTLLDDKTILFDRDSVEAKILEIVEAGDNAIAQTAPGAKRVIKPWFRMTADERVDNWLEMQKRWQRDKISKLEMA